MKAVVVETNVLEVANFGAEQAGLDCISTCVSALESARLEWLIVIDSKMRLFSEYFEHANRSGQPGVGDAFVKWLWDNQAFPKHCEMVDITPTGADEEDYAEFPNDPSLAGFDRSDRKFAAVAKASAHAPKILNATDSDWWHYNSHFERHGISVDFLCPALVQKKQHKHKR